MKLDGQGTDYLILNFGSLGPSGSSGFKGALANLKSPSITTTTHHHLSKTYKVPRYAWWRKSIEASITCNLSFSAHLEA